MTPDDAVVLRVFAGRPRRPDAHFALPSGIVLTADEANVFTDAYLPVTGLPDRSVPDHMRNNQITITLDEYARELATQDQLRAYGRQMWLVACYFAGCALIAVALLLWALFARAA